MHFAVVDIETTGGFPHQHGITEIAIVCMNGREIEHTFETLLNPGQPIPPFIANMTGISDDMVALAPSFNEQAEKIFNLLCDRIFVAHNVNFDYSFVKYFLQQAGYHLQSPKLCTIRLARKVFPGLPKYGLGHLSRSLDITITHRHRAGGDAKAAATVLSMALEKSGDTIVKEMLRREGKHQLLPPNLSVDQINALPQSPGVYYFRDKKGKVIYVGKAKQIRKRVISHFTGLDTSEKRQALLKSIYTIGHTICASELLAGILESIEIKRLWPAFNKSQKRFEAAWSIYHYMDAAGFRRLAIDKKNKFSAPVCSFGLQADAHRTLWKIVRSFDLHPFICYLEKTPSSPLPQPAEHNLRIENALEHLVEQQSNYVIRDQDGLILVEQGRFYGMSQSIPWHPDEPIESLRQKLTPYPENEMIRTLLRQFRETRPERFYPIKNN
ncbi:MAG: GIY-YIG nuclease family protein [Sediminibacterium sp.]|nr:GIY-YIG nuclease family protein [Sediminibacterium sp.]